MRRLLAPLASGVAVAALLYGILWAAERRLPEPEDPWLDAWVTDGLKAEFRAVSSEPNHHLLAGDLRAIAELPEFGGTVLRSYLVQNISVQVVRLPKAGLLPQVAEGRSFEARYKEQGNVVNACRKGRTILFVAGTGKWIPIVGQMKTQKRDAERIFDSFEETERRYP